jgi:hypothetical protein
MPSLRSYLRRATRQPARGLRARHALERAARGFPLSRLLGARQAGFHEAAGLSRRARVALAACALALLASCSAPKLAYNRLDWVAAWEIGKFVELDGRSKRLFDSGFASLWRWHRSTQLSVYAQDLREVARIAKGPVTADEVRDYMARAREHGHRLLDEAVPHTAPVLAVLDEAQVRELLEGLAERRREEIEEFTGRTPEEGKEERARVMARGIKRWFGSVNEEQEMMARIWAGTRRDDPDLWLRYGDQWDRAFALTLATRARPGFEARVRSMFLEPQLPDAAAVRAQNEHNREAFVRFVEKLAASLSPAQRRHFQKKILGLAEDLESLSGGDPASAGSIG